MEYKCISADCHIDLNWLPHNIFVSNASQAMKDRVPFVEQRSDGPMWVTKAGLNLGFANGKGGTGASGAGRKYTPGREHRLDRFAAEGLFSDGVNNIFRPTTPELRVKDQDRDGIQAEILYGLIGQGQKVTDRDAAVEMFRIYNDWLSNFCSYDRKRFVGLAAIPSHSVDAAVAETRRCAKLGMGGLDFSVAWNMTPVWNPYWDPFWKAAAEANLPVHFHTLSPPPVAPVPEDLPAPFKLAAQATTTIGFPLHSATILAAVLQCGALERYPDLRVVLGESGIGWLAYVLERMDNLVEEGRYTKLPIKKKPSEYWHRQCKATFQFDRTGLKLLDDIGVDNVMWGSDYPHSDSVWPDSQDYIKRQFSHLPAAVQRKITCENVGKFLWFDVNGVIAQSCVTGR